MWGKTLNDISRLTYLIFLYCSYFKAFWKIACQAEIKMNLSINIYNATVMKKLNVLFPIGAFIFRLIFVPTRV
jgi:hypothetical protein